jgi:hypothetical protein
MSELESEIVPPLGTPVTAPMLGVPEVPGGTVMVSEVSVAPRPVVNP